MRLATRIVPAGTWPRAEERDCITLPYDERHRRRVRLVADRGTEFLLDLPEAAVMREGDGLALDDGGYVAVRAAAEELVEVRAGAATSLARLAWHLGNRHLPAEIGAERILIRRDHVIEDMLRGLGAGLRPVRSAFNPESGAYAAGTPGTHGHHPHDHRHDHDEPHGHDHPHDHAHPHRPGRER